MKAREVGSPMDSAAADAIEHQDLGRVPTGLHHWVVLRPPTNVRAEVKRTTPDLNFPVGTRGWIVLGPHPVTLLQTDYLGAEVREPLCHHSPGGSRPDHQNVRSLFGHHCTSLSRWDRFQWPTDSGRAGGPRCF